MSALTDDPSGVRAALMGLVRRDLVGPDRSLLAGDEAFRFRHLLIRDAAYDAIPKAVRADLHERFAGWLADVAGDRIEEQEEILAYHLEQAYRLRSELGPLGDRAVEMGIRGAHHLRAAAQRASERGDPPASASLLRRSADLLPDEHPERPLMLYDAANELEYVGDAPAALELADQAERAATAAGQTVLAWRARIARGAFRMLVDPRGTSTDQVREEIREAITAFEELGDEAGLATAWRRLAETEWLPCRFDDAREYLRRAVEHARRAEDAGLFQYAMGMLLATDLFGSTPPRDAIQILDAAADELPQEGLVGEHLVSCTAACSARCSVTSTKRGGSSTSRMRTPDAWVPGSG